MICAYNENYLEDASCTLGVFLDHMVNDRGYNPDKALQLFSNSSVGQNFEKGNPKYIAGMSGSELAVHLIYELTGIWDTTAPLLPEHESPKNVSSKVLPSQADRSSFYWTG